MRSRRFALSCVPLRYDRLVKRVHSTVSQPTTSSVRSIRTQERWIFPLYLVIWPNAHMGPIERTTPLAVQAVDNFPTWPPDSPHLTG